MNKKSHIQIPQCLLSNFTHNEPEKHGNYENKIPYVYVLNLSNFEYSHEKKRLFNAVEGYYSDNNENLLSVHVEGPFANLCKTKIRKPNFTYENLDDNDIKIIKTFMRFSTTRSKRVPEAITKNLFLRKLGIKSHDDIITHSLRDDDYAEYDLVLIHNITKKDFIVACNYTINIMHDNTTCLFMPVTPKIGFKLFKTTFQNKTEILSNENDVLEINIATAKAEINNSNFVIAKRIEEFTDIAIAFGKKLTMKKEDA